MLMFLFSQGREDFLFPYISNAMVLFSYLNVIIYNAFGVIYVFAEVFFKWLKYNKDPSAILVWLWFDVLCSSPSWFLESHNKIA